MKHPVKHSLAVVPKAFPRRLRGPKPSRTRGSRPGELKKLYEHIRQLESHQRQHKRVQNALRELECRYHSLVAQIPDVVYSLDEQGLIITVNKAVTAYGYSPESLIGRRFVELVHENDRDNVSSADLDVMARKKDYLRTLRFRFLTRTGEIRWFEANCAIRFAAMGQFVRQEGVCRDITEKMHMEQNLIKAHAALVDKVRAHTNALIKVNQELQKEIEERRMMERVLRDREQDLELEKINLQSANTALKVLLKRREADRDALQEQVLFNVQRLVAPYLNKVRRECVDERHKSDLGIAAANLDDLTCNFARRLSLTYHGLSQSEFKVADFVRRGKKNREIAELMRVSVRTVEAFRQSIRNKLRLQNKKVNLRTFLMSISKQA